MNIQYLENGKERLAVIPAVDLERLIALAEDAEDIKALNSIDPKEETYPQELVEKLINSNSPLAVWREYRKLTQKELQELSGVDQGYIAQLETGPKKGGVDTLRKLAVALDVSLDDLVSESRL
jgi:DNA-binding Xre family transcriptional regulator